MLISKTISLKDLNGYQIPIKYNENIIGKCFISNNKITMCVEQNHDEFKRAYIDINNFVLEVNNEKIY